jgi:DNA-binding LacI/PurR family transcriptional regulator
MVDPVILKTISKVVHNQGQISPALQLLAIPEPGRPTAIVTLLDTIAIGAMQAVETCRLIIGCDIAVTGFDVIPTTRHLQPALTTMRQPVGVEVRAVFSLLLAQFNGEQSAIQPLMLSSERVRRESSQGFGRDDHEKGALSTLSA